MRSRSRPEVIGLGRGQIRLRASGIGIGVSERVPTRCREVARRRRGTAQRVGVGEGACAESGCAIGVQGDTWGVAYGARAPG